MPLTLPQFTFISGPSQSGKTTLASLLSKHDPQSWSYSLLEPLRMGLIGTFREDALFDLSYDLKSRKQLSDPLPVPARDGSPLSNQWFMDRYRFFLENYFGESVLSILAEREWEAQTHYYRRLVLDDVMKKDDLAAFTTKGPENLLHIHLSRNGVDWFSPSGEDLFGLPGKHFALYNDGTPDLMITKIWEWLKIEESDPTPPNAKLEQL